MHHNRLVKSQDGELDGTTVGSKWEGKRELCLSMWWFKNHENRKCSPVGQGQEETLSPRLFLFWVLFLSLVFVLFCFSDSGDSQSGPLHREAGAMRSILPCHSVTRWVDLKTLRGGMGGFLANQPGPLNVATTISANCNRRKKTF